MHIKSEYDIHALIRNYPYLLGDEFANLKMKHEKIYEDRTRADFIFTSDTLSIVVEVKKGPIDIEMLNQALHYLRNEQIESSGKTLKCVLVGSRVHQEVENKVSRIGFSFEIKLLNIDVPTKIKICDNCRRANPLTAVTCRYCKSRKFITDPFLFYEGSHEKKYNISLW
jgi:hypothetical protein